MPLRRRLVPLLLATVALVLLGCRDALLVRIEDQQGETPTAESGATTGPGSAGSAHSSRSGCAPDGEMAVTAPSGSYRPPVAEPTAPQASPNQSSRNGGQVAAPADSGRSRPRSRPGR